MRYTDRRKKERSARNNSDWADKFIKPLVPCCKSDEPRIPVRIDHKTVALVRLSNFHKYTRYFYSPQAAQRHLEAFLEKPFNHVD